MDTVKISINNIAINASKGSTVLEAAKTAGIYIPTLCYLKDISRAGACRMCLVEITGKKGCFAACSTKVEDGMEITTDSPVIEAKRKMNLELICSAHRQDCSRCQRFPYCELHTLCRRYGIDDRENMFNREPEIYTSIHLERDNSKCILCRRCVSMCGNTQGIGALAVLGRGGNTRVNSNFASPAESLCVNCGQCITVCPTGALSERLDTHETMKALTQRKKFPVAIVSPFAVAQIGDYFHEPSGKELSGKTVAALHRLGFKLVLDASPSAERMTHLYKTYILSQRERTALPVIFSGCPSVKKLFGTKYPKLIDSLLQPPSPADELSRYCRYEYAKQLDVNPEDMFVVMVTPCAADKYKYSLPENKDLADAVLTTHELYLMFERACVSSFSAIQTWSELKDEPFDIGGKAGNSQNGCNMSTMCTALTESSASVVLQTSSKHGDINEYKYISDGDGIKAAYADGLKNVQELLNRISTGKTDYTYVELMACPGGCKNGAGKARILT